MPELIKLISAVVVLAGALFMLIATIGLFRYEDVYLKLHAASKAGTLGAGLILLGVGLELTSAHGITEIIVLVLFIAITNPISAHLIARVYGREQEQDLLS